jgi:ectoine hydroxylase-related dioxygenase (phytanoyl-CoA dioxygenase family)
MLINKKNSILKSYKNEGFVVIKNFFSKKKIIVAKKNILKLSKKSQSKLLFYEKNKKDLRRIENVVSFSVHAKKIIADKKLTRIIKSILGKNTLFKDKLNFKYPKANGFEPHVDGHFLWKSKNSRIKKGWKAYSNQFINVVIPLEKTNKKNGCLELAEIKDTKKNLGNSWEEITKKTLKFTPKIKKKYIKKFNFIPVEINIGDILLFDWKVCHRSKKNHSENSRMIFYATFAKNKKRKDLKEQYYKDKISSINTIANKSLN